MIPPTTAQALTKRPSLVEQTCAMLADHIASEFGGAEGENWLPSERELAARFGVSRPVIREATKRLELQGLIEISHGRGIKVVSQLQRPMSHSLELRVPESGELLRQLGEARRLLEPGLARLAAARRTKKGIQRLEKRHLAMERAGDVVEAAAEDALFHQEIARVAGNEVIALILSSFGDLGETVRRHTLSTTGKEKALEHHAAILEAIREGDGDAAETWMLTHVTEAAKDLEKSEAATG